MKQFILYCLVLMLLTQLIPCYSNKCCGKAAQPIRWVTNLRLSLVMWPVVEQGAAAGWTCVTLIGL